MQMVANGLNNKEVIGSGWRIMERRFPSLNIPSSEYIVIFDPS